jgi:hypothetical protein
MKLSINFGLIVKSSLPKLSALFFASSETSNCLFAILVVILGSFVYYRVEEADVIIPTGVCPALVFFTPIRWYYDSEAVVYQVHLYLSVNFSSSSQTGRCVYLNQPGLELRIDQNIKTVKLETVLVVDHDLLNSFQRYVNDVVNFFKTFIAGSLALGLFQVEFQVRNRPFTAMFIVVIGCLFRYGNICQVDEHIVALCHIVTVLFDTETCKPKVIKINF